MSTVNLKNFILNCSNRHQIAPKKRKNFYLKFIFVAKLQKAMDLYKLGSPCLLMSQIGKSVLLLEMDTFGSPGEAT